MTRDIRNVTRGQCQACGDCEGFISVSGRVLCDYCGCPPTHHEILASGCSAAANKKARPEDETDLSEVNSLEILELEDDDDDEEDEDYDDDDDVEEDEEVESPSKKSGYMLLSRPTPKSAETTGH